jgi:hypothetical protein
MPPPTEDVTVPFFLLGMMLGAIVTLLVQAYGRKKARLAAADTVPAGRAIELLSSENEQQQGLIGRLEERIAVLERIATDPAERTHRAIELLR